MNRFKLMSWGTFMWHKWVVVIVLAWSVFVSAQELTINGDFSSGGDYWSITNGGVWSDYGSSALKVWAAGGQWDVGYAYEEIAVTVGEIYTFSVDVLNPSAEPLQGTGGTAFIKLEFRDNTGNTINGDYGTVLDIIDGTYAQDTWLPLSGSMVAPAGSVTVRAVLMSQKTVDDGVAVAWFDNASLTGPSVPVINSPDYDSSLKVDFLDFAKLVSVWQSTSSTYNLSGSNDIDLEDLELFASAWLTVIDPYEGYELVWSDEFYGPNIDTGNWNWEIGDGGWGNEEWQYYTSHSDNSYISDGSLVIAARKDHLGHSYTSARMTTKNKQSFQYGRLEARIKLPQGGAGIWPAYWMLGSNFDSAGWPRCGEIDILEAINDFTHIHGTLHYGTGNPWAPDNNGGAYEPSVDVSDDYHVYAIEWEPTVFRWYFDGVNYYTSSNWWSVDAYPAPFNQPFFFILNIAVGGRWPGYPDASTPFPQYMHIDYVRVYEKTSP